MYLLIYFQIIMKTLKIILNFAQLCADVGRVYKIVQWYDEEGESSSVLLDVFDVTSNEPIRAMALSRAVSQVYNSFVFAFFRATHFLITKKYVRTKILLQNG